MTKRFRTILIDDEDLARKDLIFHLKPFNQIEIIAETENVNDSVSMINKLNPDLVFLDIQLFGESGFRILDETKVDYHVIFVTAYDKFAIRAFDINALDYLLKPVDPERLKISINRLSDSQKQNTNEIKQFNYYDRILINNISKYVFVKISSIKVIMAEGDYTRIITSEGAKHMVLKSLKTWESQLPERHFKRIHRSTIVNLEYIEKIEKWSNNTLRVFLYGSPEPFIISQRETPKFKENYM